MKTSTKGLLYFVNWTTLERQIIQFVPFEVNENRASNLTEHNVIGRNQPVIQWGSGSTTLTLDLTLYGENVRSRVAWLEQFTFKEIGENPPPLLKIVWDTLIPQDALWSVQSINPVYSLFMPAANFEPRMCNLNIQLIRNTSRNITFVDINNF